MIQRSSRLGTRSWLAAILGLALLAIAVSLPVRPVAAGGPGGVVHVVRVVSLGHLSGAGVAAYGDQWVFVGTGTARTLDVLNPATDTIVQSITLPGLTPPGVVPLDMDMVDMALAPDHRMLYVLNMVRQDVVALDLTGHSRPASFALKDSTSARLSVSPDSRLLAITGGTGVTVLNAATGAAVMHTAGVAAWAFGPGDSMCVLWLHGRHGTLGIYEPNGHMRFSVRLPEGTPLTPAAGSLALSPNGQILYVLWNGLRSVSFASGRVLGTLSLPPTPAYTRLTVAPDGRQLLVWAPAFSGTAEYPSASPGYVHVTYGFISGGVQPVTLPSLTPAASDPSLRTLNTPMDVTYSADSAWAYVTTLDDVAVVRTGTRGQPAPASPVPASVFTAWGRNATTPAVTRPPGSGASSGHTCSAWQVTGNWTFTPTTGSPLGSGSGIANLTQSGSAVHGSVDLGGTSWRLSGTLTGTRLTLTWSASGQIDETFVGRVAAGGTTIAGNLGSFHDASARCA